MEREKPVPCCGKDFTPDALPGTTLTIFRLGTVSTNGCNNDGGWLIQSLIIQK
jgi:hypothetical protein